MAKASTQGQIVAIQDLQPGMMVIQVTAQNGPVKVRKSGRVTSFEMVQGLTEMGVLELEIDPSQTLDIEPPTQPRKLSQTQELMQADVTGESVDATLSDQFNRSLFMPSIRDLRSAWYYNATRYLTGLVVLLFGVAVGFGGSKSVDLIKGLNEYSIVKGASRQVPSEHATEQDPTSLVSEGNDETDLVLDSKRHESIQVTNIENPETETHHSTQDSVNEQNVATDEGEEDSALVQRHPLDVELSEEEIQKRIIRPNKQADAPVSKDLLAKFNQALSELEQAPTDEDVVEDSAPNVIRIDQLPAWALTSLPPMSFSTHIFASNKQDRWVRVNGIEMREGDWIDDQVQILEITQHHVILNYQGQSFRMAALTDW